MLDMDFPYQSEHVTIGKGERLLLYTDGITEATDGQNRMYEADTPLQLFVTAHKPDRAGLFIQDLIADIKRFTGNAPQSDDITALYLLRRLTAPSQSTLKFRGLSMTPDTRALRCLNCGRSDDEVPLVAVCYRGTEMRICPQCLPTLIHHPDQLAGKLAAPKSRRSTKL